MWGGGEKEQRFLHLVKEVISFSKSKPTSKKGGKEKKIIIINYYVFK